MAQKYVPYLILALVYLTACQETSIKQRDSDFNFDWKFSLGDFDDASQPSYDDSGWRNIRLPHDWSVEASFDSTLEGCTGYLPGGIGWYRKHFKIENPEEGVTYIHFDGIYNNSEIWLNGTRLGFHPYGYSPFYFDITDHLSPDGEYNVLAVKVDRTRYVDSRWYTGSGIYRNVKLVRTGKIHIPVWGTFITTPEVTSENAVISLETTLKNSYQEVRQFELSTVIVGSSGNMVNQLNEELSLAANEEITITRRIPVEAPNLWDTDNPNLYKAVQTIFLDGEPEDEYETRFGIRSIKFDPDRGFFLNGKNLKIKGVCLHHDGGLVGAAVPKGVWKRRLEILREGGCNAIRSAHNPASDEFLDLCDEMGFLVQDEFFDEWDNPKDKRLNGNERIVDDISRGYGEHFQEWAETDLKTTMLSHRNHPSIFQWSIGNEIEWTYPRYSHATGFFDMDWQGNYFWSQPPIPPEMIKKRYEDSPPGEYVLAETAQKLGDWVREMDKTRPVIANCILPSSSHVTGYTDALDMVGYSYRRVLYDYGHELYPDKPIMGTENLGQWHEWKAVEERQHIAGLFIWTGIDYMGESNRRWPTKAQSTGLLNHAGFPEPSWHMYRTLWNDKPHLYIASQIEDKSIFKVAKDGQIVEKEPGAWETRVWYWHDVNEHWNYDNGEKIIAEVITNCAEVELFINDRSLGVKKLEDFEDRIMKWALPFEDGKIEARASKDGLEAEYSIVTHGKPAGISLLCDKEELTADGYDVAHLIVQLTDKDGNPVLSEEAVIEFEIEGDVSVLGVDNGAVDNVQDFQSNKLLTRNGRCLLIIQSHKNPGSVEVRARSGDIISDPAILVIN